MSYGGGCCNESDLIDALSTGLDEITEALDAINETLQDDHKKVCDNLDECMDEIEQQIRARFNTAAKGCDECKAMIANGLAGSVEFAIACAGACIEEVPEIPGECSPGSEGEPCSTCGESPCCCVAGVCAPCGIPQPKKKYYAWCDPQGGEVIVNDTPNTPPFPNGRIVATGDNEQVVFDEGLNTCKTYQDPLPPFKNPDPLYFPTGNFTTCPIEIYKTTAGLDTIVQGGATIFENAGFAEQNAAIARLGLDGINLGNIGEVMAGIYTATYAAPPMAAHAFLPSIATAIGCSHSTWVKGMEVVTAVGIVEKFTGANISQYTQSITYAINASCRRIFLNEDKSIAAFLANAIDYASLDTHWAVQGLCPQEVEAYVQAAKSKPMPQQLGLMRMREIISASEYQAGMRQLGFLEPQTSENLFKLFQQLPTLSDIIRLMVRDADDDSLATTLGLDTQFDQKYGKQLRKWSEQQGVPELFAKYAWRAHWEIPSPTQLFEFWRRLRRNPAFGGEDKLWKDIEAALIQQDILPYWHNAYKAINFVPLGRVDIRRMFQIGTLSDAELEPAISQLGYSDENTTKLAKFTKRLRDLSAPSHRAIKLWLRFAIDRNQARQRMVDDGLPGDLVDKALSDSENGFASSPYAASFVRGDMPRDKFLANLAQFGVSNQGSTRLADLLSVRITSHPAEQDYVAGVISRDEASQQMRDYGMNTDVIERILRVADQAVNHQFVVNCQRGIKRRYLSGELDKMDATNELTNRGTSPERATKLVNWWDCERGSLGRPLPTAKLCSWLQQGIISTTDFLKRLERLGYSIEDSNRILNDCLISQNQKLLAQAKKDAKEQAAESLRSARLAAKAASTLRREISQQQRAVNQSKQTAVRREKQLLHVVELLQALCNCSIYDVKTAVTDNKNRLQHDFGLSVDESLQALTTAAENWAGGSLGDYSAQVTALAEIVATAGLSPLIDSGTDVVLTSG